jgi:hypothetical protein
MWPGCIRCKESIEQSELCLVRLVTVRQPPGKPQPWECVHRLIDRPGPSAPQYGTVSQEGSVSALYNSGPIRCVSRALYSPDRRHKMRRCQLVSALVKDCTRQFLGPAAEKSESSRVWSRF